MKKLIPVILILCVLSDKGFSQKKANTFLVLSYNVENLFDTVDAPGFKDEDFTPGGIKNWTWERYEEKLDMLSKVITSIPGKEMPALIGLAEVENRTVLEDLVHKRGLRRSKYEIIHEDGIDPRTSRTWLCSLHKHLITIMVKDISRILPQQLGSGLIHSKNPHLGILNSCRISETTEWIW